MHYVRCTTFTTNSAEISIKAGFPIICAFIIIIILSTVCFLTCWFIVCTKLESTSENHNLQLNKICYISLLWKIIIQLYLLALWIYFMLDANIFNIYLLLGKWWTPLTHFSCMETSIVLFWARGNDVFIIWFNNMSNSWSYCLIIPWIRCTFQTSSLFIITWSRTVQTHSVWILLRHPYN